MAPKVLRTPVCRCHHCGGVLEWRFEKHHNRQNTLIESTIRPNNASIDCLNPRCHGFDYEDPGNAVWVSRSDRELTTAALTDRSVNIHGRLQSCTGCNEVKGGFPERSALALIATLAKTNPQLDPSTGLFRPQPPSNVKLSGKGQAYAE